MSSLPPASDCPHADSAPSGDDEIFADALDLAEPQRSLFIERACSGDTVRQARLRSLLTAAEESHGFLDQPVAVASGYVIEARPGDAIGPYTLVAKIGEGGCGIVWDAVQRSPPHRHVALKEIRLGIDTREVVARFERERRALALMHHPGIAKAFDAGTTDSGRPFFAMELVHGVPITRYCDEHQFDVPTRLALFIAVCRAVQHAHRKGIIHRDLKPSNILVSDGPDGEPRPKVIDFGIAKALQGQLGEQAIHTAFQALIGTPAYMSPEQAEPGAGEIDERSDLYSLGALLYELLVGDTPLERKDFTGSDPEEVRAHLSRGEVVAPSVRFRAFSEELRARIAHRRACAPATLDALLTGPLDALVQRCLERDRARRYPSLKVLVTDLRRFLQQANLGSRPPLGAALKKLLRWRRR